MTGTCPKCNAALELDPSTVPPEGSFVNCAACHANLEVHRQSFAGRALFKSAEIACTECGKPPGMAIYCENCHAVYPDLLTITTASAAKKQWGKIAAALSRLTTRREKDAGIHYDPLLGSQTPGKTQKSAKVVGKPIQLAIIAIVAVVALLAGGYYWYQDKIATTYAQNYVRAFSGVKSARDLDLKICKRVVDSMRSGAGSTLTPAESKSLASAKSDVDKLMSRLGEVPGKFKANNDALLSLNDSFGQLHAAVSAPSGMADTIAGTVTNLDNNFMKSARELKAGLPEKIADILAESTKKYKALQDI